MELTLRPLTHSPTVEYPVEYISLSSPTYPAYPSFKNLSLDTSAFLPQFPLCHSISHTCHFQGNVTAL